MTVHNHGPWEGPSRDGACPETRLPDGSLRGSCLRPQQPNVVQQAARVLRDHGWRNLGVHTTYGTTVFGCWACDWQGDSSSIATHQAQMLANAGLLPTEQAWGVQHPDLDVVLVTDRRGFPITSDEEARAVADGFFTPASVKTRRNTPWRDLT